MNTASDVACYIIWRASDDEQYGDNITNLKLQKLLYYAQGFHLALTDEPLFEDAILAWRHGPVVPSIYFAYRALGSSSPIPPPEDFDPEIIAKESRDIIEDMYSVYGQYSAWGLRNLTHEEAPWRETPHDHEIPRDKIRDYFREHLLQ